MPSIAETGPCTEAAWVQLQAMVDEAVSASSDLTPRAVVAVMERITSSAAAISAMAMQAMAAAAHEASGPVDAAGELVPEPEFVADEIAVTVHCSTVAARRRYQLALDAARHPSVMTHWAAGVISAAAVQVITEVLAPLDPADPATCDLVYDAVDHATAHTPSQTRAWLTRRVLTVDPEAAEQRRRRASADRRVVITPGVDAMASIWAWLPAVQARQIFTTIDAVATAACPDDARTTDQRRADAFVDLVLGRAVPPQVQVQVVTTAATLAGDQSAEPAEVAGVGPVLPSELAELLQTLEGEQSFRALRVDPDSGHLVAVGEHQYRPSKGLRRAVTARDVLCRFPGCRRSGSAPGVDLDHTIPWPAGATDASNLAVLCRRHHRLKHSPGWHARLHPDGVMTWTTPDGLTIETAPWRYPDPRAP